MAGPEQSADIRVAYTLDAIRGEPTCYLQVKTSDGGRFGYVRELTNEPGLPVTEPPSVAPLPMEPVLESRPLPDTPVAAPAAAIPPNTVHNTGTASRIAKRNGVPVADFCCWNNVEPRETLYAGHRVWLHEPPVTPTPAAANASFKIALDTIPQDECTQLAKFQPDAWLSVDVNGTAVEGNSDIAAIVGACAAANTITYEAR